MNQDIIEIKEGIKLHVINTNKFKTNLLSVFITTKLDRKTVTENAVIPAVLRRGNANMKTMEEISVSLENMYGSSFDCGIEKTGENQVLKFYLESINDKYAENESNSILESSINVLLDIILNPLIENDGFKKEYVSQEKENIKTIIKSKIDDKAQYSLDRCIEEMYKDKPYGLYKYGYIEDLKNISEKSLCTAYLNLINTCKIDIFISGEFDKEQIKGIINNLEIIRDLKPRTPDYIPNTDEQIKSDLGNKSSSTSPKTVEETMDITQGKLVMGCKINTVSNESKYISSMYNAILRRNSKFKNVSKCERKKQSSIYSWLYLYKTKK